MRALLVAGLFTATTALAAWPTTAAQDVRVGTNPRAGSPNVVSDGAGGVFVVWSELDTSVAPNAGRLMAEHFDARGTRLWSTGLSDGGFTGRDLLGLDAGLTSEGLDRRVLAITDGAGGFIAIYTGGGINALTLQLQRFDASGAPQWTTNGSYGGVQLLAQPYFNAFIATSDGAGGALLVFINSDFTVRAQRLDGTGAVKYGFSGYSFGAGQMPTAPYDGLFMVSGGQGDLYNIWAPSGAATQSPSLAHVSPTGTAEFSRSIAPQQATFGQWAIAPGAQKSVWASWFNPSANPATLYLQRFENDGGAALDGGAAGGVGFYTFPANIGANPAVTLVPDGDGGVVATWFDRAAINVLLSQRFGPSGEPLWATGPVINSGAMSIPSPPLSVQHPFRVLRGPGGDVAVFWGATPEGIYAEKLALASGAARWGGANGGVAVSTAGQVTALDVTFEPSQGAFVGFARINQGIFLKHLRADGTLGDSVPFDAGTGDAGGTAHNASSSE